MLGFGAGFGLGAGLGLGAGFGVPGAAGREFDAYVADWTGAATRWLT